MALIEMSPPPAPVRVGRHLYVRAPEPLHFPSEESLEEAVSETKRHLEARTTLYLLLKDAFANHAIGSDQFMYYCADDPRKCLAPDVFVKLGTPDEAFETWKVWERGTPDIAVEIVSKSDRRDDDWDDKLARYAGTGVRELVRFDGDDAARPIRVWDRIDDDLVERADSDPALRECATLGLWWLVVPTELGPTLRLARDIEGRELLPTPGEERIRLAEELHEERKARQLAEHERLLAEHRATEAERERDAALAEAERLRAELAKARTNGHG